MSDLDDLQLGRLIQTVENLEQTCERLEKSVDKLESKVEEQDLLIHKGKTAVTVILGVLGAVWAGVELYFGFKT